MFINLTIQMLWIAYAPITGPAARFYGVTDLQIGLLAMSFMMAFIPLSIPVSWAIDTYGFRLTVSIGAVLMGVFGVLRGLAGGRLHAGAAGAPSASPSPSPSCSTPGPRCRPSGSPSRSAPPRWAW